MARTTYVAGPGVVVYDSRSFFTEGDIKIVDKFELDPINVAYYGGEVDNITTQRLSEISFTPCGELEDADLDAVFHHQAKHFGDDLFPAVDKTLKVFGADGSLRTYSAAACYRYPVLNLFSGANPWGEVTFLCLGSGDTDWSTANSLVQIQTGQTAPSELTSDALTAAAMNRAWYKGNWPATGAVSPWADFTTVKGFKIEPTLQLYPKGNDRYGNQNYGIRGFEVKCTFTPNGITESDILTAKKIQGSGINRGATLSGKSLGDLKITSGVTIGGATLTAYVKGAAIIDSDEVYGLETPRVNTVTMKATVATFGATLGDLFSISMA